MKIFCIGRNYVEHAAELGNETPTEPVIFIKPKTALVSSFAQFYYPHLSNELHYETELVLQISKNGKFVSAHNAWHYYNAITVGIDFTARDIQSELKKKGLPWEKAKGWDGSAVVGSFQKFPSNRFKSPFNFSLSKNGETVQTGNSDDMIFSFNKIIAEISQYWSLAIGDLIFTGTPAGVGECVVEDVLEGFLEGEKVLSIKVR